MNPASLLSLVIIFYCFVKVDTNFSGISYLDDLDDVTGTDDFRIKLHMGFAGGEGHRGVSDAICLCELGLDVVNTGGTGHPCDLQDRRTKLPRLRRAFPMYLRNLSGRQLLPGTSTDANPSGSVAFPQCQGRQ